MLRPAKFEPLTMWTVYERPSDHPDGYVARLWKVDAAGERAASDVLYSKSLAWIRTQMERRGLVCIPRCRDDDPVIVETWL